MSFLRRHAALLAFLAVLLCCAAAPYLVPEDPDSPVFRGGALPLLLMLGCWLPAGGALRRASGSVLILFGLLGLLLSAALSVGAELTFYEEFLEGGGSLLRRLAVPLMAAPLAALLLARLSFIRVRPREDGKGHMLLFSCLLFLLWLPMLLAYWPGMLNYDFAGEFAQHTSGSYSSIHPLLHSALQNGVFALSERFSGRTAGLLALSLSQMALFALALGRACAFVRRRAGTGAAVLLLAFFGLHPVFSTLSCSMTKDTLFAAALLTLSLDVWEMLEGRTPGVLRILRFILCAVSVALLRTNGFAALLPLLLCFCLGARGARVRALLLSLGGIAAALAVQFALTLALRPTSFPSFQFFSLPAQQLVRAYDMGRLTGDEEEELLDWYTDEAGLEVHPHLADPAKGYLDRERLQREGASFLSLWRRVGGHAAKEYAEAFLLLNIGSWYPDDKSHATIYPDVSWNDKGYLQTQELQIEGIETRTFLPRLRAFVERICRRNEYQSVPVLSLLFCPGLYLWILLYACCLLIARGRARLLPAASGAFFLWAGYLLGPCTLPRYMLPLFCLAPVLLCAALALPERK